MDREIGIGSLRERLGLLAPAFGESEPERATRVRLAAKEAAIGEPPRGL